MRKSFLTVALVILCAFALSAQEPYKMPPQDVVDILEAAPPARVSLSPAGDRMLLIEYETMPMLADLARPILRLAGMRITPHNNSRQALTFNTAMTVKTIKDGTVRKIEITSGARFGMPSWSPDGKRIAFAVTTDSGAELWTADAATGVAKRLTGPVLNMVLGPGLSWMPGSASLLVGLIPENRGPAPVPPAVPDGPNIQESKKGVLAKAATFQDLLKTPFEEILFDYYATSQIAAVDVSTGDIRPISEPGIFPSADPSPDGKYLLLYRVKKPYSRSLPWSGFARSYEIWDTTGRIVKIIADLPPAENVPINGVPTGPRAASWRPLKPASVYWTEALDEGDLEKDVPHRDRVMVLDAPFEAGLREVIRLRQRYAGITWLQTPGRCLVTEMEWRKSWRTTWLADIDTPGAEPRKLFDLNFRDAYNNPGFPVTTTTPAGMRVVLEDKGWIYLDGQGASPKGDFPFLDGMNLKTGEKKRLFQSADGTYQSFVGFPGGDRNSILITHETPTEPPNYYLLDLKSKKKRALTQFQDPAPQLTGIKKQLIKYQREDGLELSGTLYLPPDYKEGERRPAVVWAYPLEYTSADTAGQVRGSPYRFTYFRGTSQLFFVTQGYVVLDNAQMPLVGDPKTVNDTFVPQLVMNAKAAVDVLDKLGVADPKRVGVGGHSYGAFMTANLLAHSDVFAAGIARSGAYNRTLTPFGFQSERRTFWEAPETYLNMSPFMHAPKINEPILLIHGEVDNNSGTFPIQSERLFQALKGFGAETRLVMLPYESHGYAARESVFHVLAEMFDWFDTHVKNRK
jgi:dipeptidyl aminopeptidase/acylaminoacyl peptidase